MKFTAFLCLVACLQVSAAGTAQRVTFSGKEVSLKRIFRELNRQTGFEFLYKDVYLKEAKPVSLSVENSPIAEVLAICFINQPLSYEIIDNTVIVKAKPEGHLSASVKSPRPVLETPPITVKGRITNENGEPVVASIIIRGTERGTTSDVNGNFELDHVEEKAALIITATNIETTTINVNGKNDIQVVVKIAVSSMGEVVVNKGYYTESRRTSTGNTSKVTSKEISNQPVTNPITALIGRMPGVSIQQTSGAPGAAINLQIRGRNSLRDEGNIPLYIIDGVPVTSTGLSNNTVSGQLYNNKGSSPFNTLNPSDIEAIEVLKDADATAIYGSRGANGVVLITTKKGKQGKTAFDLNINQGIGSVRQRMDLLDTKQYIEMRLEAIDNDGLTPYLLPEYANFFPDIMLWDTTKYTDWQKEFFGGHSNVTNVQANVSGGNANTQFLIGGQYHRETTVFPGDFSYQKSTSHLNINHTSENRRFKLSFLASYGIDDNRMPRYDLTPIALSLSPNLPSIYNEDGTLNWRFMSNPFALYAKTEYLGKTKSLITNATIEYNIVDRLNAKLNAGYSTSSFNEIQKNPIIATNPAQNITSGSAMYGGYETNTWILEPQLVYNRETKIGKFNGLIGLTFQERSEEGQSLSAGGFRSDDLLENIRFATTLAIENATYIQYKYSAAFGRLNYNYLDKYIINLTARRDGSSRFGPGKQFANFGAVGVAWVFSSEKWIKENVAFLSFGKLRGSYGTTGSDQIGDYQFMDTYSPTTYPYMDIGGLIPGKLVNKNYAWEINKKIEGGLDIGLINDRLLFGITAYRNRSSNQLVGYALSVVTGFPSIQFNLPATVQNTGWEFTLNARIIQSKNLTWRSSVNYTLPKNKLVAFPAIQNYSAYRNRWVVGESLNITRRLHNTGVSAELGTYTFEDANGNGTAQYPEDITTIARGIKFYGGFGNTITFKGFELDFLFQFIKQTAENYMVNFRMPGSVGNQPVEVMNRWRKPGDVTNIQKFSAGGIEAMDAFTNATIFGDNAIKDASFIRLKNVSLSWKIPSSWVGKINGRSAKLYLQGQNLLTITNYEGLDPETATSLPPLQMITAGIQFTL